MSLLEKIKSDSLTARKARNIVLSGVLTTLYSEASMVGKNDGNRSSTDEEVVKVVKKFLKNASETMNHIKNADSIAYNDLHDECMVYQSYLPKQLTSEELAEKINSLLSSGNNIGQIMKNLKENYAGRYDAKLASQIAKG